MTVKISRDRIPWNTITDNKPTSQLFEQYKTRMTTNNNIRVNYVDFFNVDVVVPDRDITYLWINHNDEDTYWYYSQITKILPHGYVMRFKQDIWTTYTLSLLNQLQANRVPLKAVRSHILSKQAALFTDELLNSVPISYKSVKSTNVKTAEIEEKNYDENIQEKRIYISDDKQEMFLFSLNKNIIRTSTWEGTNFGNVYYVFKEKPERTGITGLTLIPSFGKMEGVGLRIIYRKTNKMFSDNWNYDPPQTPVFLDVYNKDSWLDLLVEKWGSEKFLGKFILPNVFTFLNNDNVFSFTEKIPISVITGTEQCIFLRLNLSVNGTEINTPLKLGDANLDGMEFIEQTEQVPEYNYSTKLHSLASNAIQLKWLNAEVKTNLLYEPNKGFVYDKWVCGFAQSGYIKGYHSLVRYSELVSELPSDLPYIADAYQQYVNANKNQRDNQINIWKQQRDMAISKSVFGGITGLVGNLLGASGGVKGVLNTGLSLTKSAGTLGYGIADANLSYQQNINSLKAQYADYKNVMADNVIAGNINDAVYQLQLPTYEQGAGNLVEWKELTEDTIKALNNVIYLYGVFNPVIRTLEELQPRDDFNYIQLEQHYLTTVFNENVDKKIPVECYSLILQTLSEGVRLWKRNIHLSN